MSLGRQRELNIVTKHLDDPLRLARDCCRHVQPAAQGLRAASALTTDSGGLTYRSGGAALPIPDQGDPMAAQGR
jgi:hypothetical protein